MAKIKKLEPTSRVIDEYAFDEEMTLDDGETTIRIAFNSDIMDNILGDLVLLEVSRGILTNIDSNHPEVITTARRKASQASKKQLSITDITRVVNQLRIVHEPAYKRARYELMILYIVDAHDQLLEVTDTPTGARVKLQAPYDFEIPESYWTSNNSKISKMSDMKRLAIRTASYTANEPVPDKTNPLDVMVGFAMGLLDANPLFAQKLAPYLEAAIICLQFGEVELNDESMSTFRKLMAELLLADMGKTDSDEFGEQPGGGVSDDNGHGEPPERNEPESGGTEES